MESLVDVSREQVVAQYPRGDVLLFASTYDGFGRPFVDPLAVGRIRAGIDRMLEDAAYRERRVSLGFEKVRRFDLATSAGPVCRAVPEGPGTGARWPRSGGMQWGPASRRRARRGWPARSPGPWLSRSVITWWRMSRSAPFCPPASTRAAMDQPSSDGVNTGYASEATRLAGLKVAAGSPIGAAGLSLVAAPGLGPGPGPDALAGVRVMPSRHGVPKRFTLPNEPIAVLNRVAQPAP